MKAEVSLTTAPPPERNNQDMQRGDELCAR